MSVVLLLSQAAATLFMTGVIWIVQAVHYPLFALVGRDGFGEYAREHQRRITPVVAVAMPVEAVTAVLLLFATPAGVEAGLLALGAILLLPIWLSTALLQVPAHRRLSSGFDDTDRGEAGDDELAPDGALVCAVCADPRRAGAGDRRVAAPLVV